MFPALTPLLMRFARTFLALAAFAFVLPATALAQSFPDVPENSRFFGAVSYLFNEGVVSGYPDGTFKPDQTINRAEALKIVMLATGDETGDVPPEEFPDVPSSEWFYDFVQVAVTRGIVEGYDDGTFKPGNNINVAESMKIIFLAFGADVGQPPGADPYPDVDQLAWYSAYAQYAKNRQLVWPQDDGKLHAGRDITRGEFADIIYRYMYAEENNLEKFPLSTDWQTYVSPDGYSVKYPFGWQRINADGQNIFWKEDTENNQLSWARVYPNSATVVIAVDENEEGLSLDDYFALIEYDSSASIQSQTLNTYAFKSVYMADTTTFDYYFEMPDGAILVAYSQIGEGLNKPQLVEEVRNLVGSIRHYEGPLPASVSPSSEEVTDTEVFLEQVRENILVDGQADAMVSLLGDAVIIETDSIGIGTGPVDYYYSQTYDVTLKVERDSNTILAISEEKGTAF